MKITYCEIVFQSNLDVRREKLNWLWNQRRWMLVVDGELFTTKRRRVWWSTILVLKARLAGHKQQPAHSFIHLHFANFLLASFVVIKSNDVRSGFFFQRTSNAMMVESWMDVSWVLFENRYWTLIQVARFYLKTKNTFREVQSMYLFCCLTAVDCWSLRLHPIYTWYTWYNWLLVYYSLPVNSRLLLQISSSISLRYWNNTMNTALLLCTFKLHRW